MKFWPPSKNGNWRAEQMISLMNDFPFTKIFRFRDIEGNLNRAMLRTVRSFREHLELRCDTFVGISPVGSEILGHSFPNSDIDVMVLYDSSIYGDELYSDYHAERQIYREIFEFIRMIQGQGGPKIDFYYKDVDPIYVSDGLKNSGDAQVANTVADVCSIVAGKKIGRYRSKFSEMLKNAPHARLKNIIGLATRNIVNLEKSSLRKLWGKLDLPSELFGEAIIARKSLWESRVKRLLDLQ